MMALSGVRSSWLMLARKVLLAWLATSAASLAARNAASARIRSTTRPIWVPTSLISARTAGSGGSAWA